MFKFERSIGEDGGFTLTEFGNSQSRITTILEAENQKKENGFEHEYSSVSTDIDEK